MSHLSNTPAVVLVPPEAANITILKHDKWQLYLSDYPDAALTKFFITGITQEFRLGYNSPLSSLKSAHKNLDGALQHPSVVDEYITEEIVQHRVLAHYQKLLSQFLILAVLELFPSVLLPTSGD